MAGKVCPKCKEMTFFTTPDGGRACSRSACGYTMNPPVEKGGRGRKCSNCGKYTVKRIPPSTVEKCTNCGVTYQ